jgi:hypothetical protein
MIQINAGVLRPVRHDLPRNYAATIRPAPPVRTMPPRPDDAPLADGEGY